MKEANQSTQIVSFDTYSNDGTFCLDTKLSMVNFLSPNKGFGWRRKPKSLKNINPILMNPENNNHNLTRSQLQTKINHQARDIFYVDFVSVNQW